MCFRNFSKHKAQIKGPKNDTSKPNPNLLTPTPPVPQLRVQTLRKYAEVFDVVVRPELTPNELSVAVAR